MVQVQLRIPEQEVKQIDRLVKAGRFRSRSDAIKTIIALYQEREKTREFYQMLKEIDEEAEKYPEKLVPLEKA